MALMIWNKGQKEYRSTTGVITTSEKRCADRLDAELKKSIQKLERDLLQKGLLTEEGEKKDTLRVWFEVGRVLNRISKKYKIIGTGDEPLFWQTIYGYSSSRLHKNPIPKRSAKWQTNHFRICSLMARREWSEIKRVGNWSKWKDILENSRIVSDKRLLDWVVNKAHRYNLGHKELRSLIYAVLKRLKKIDTSILGDKELELKLNEVDWQVKSQ